MRGGDGWSAATFRVIWREAGGQTGTVGPFWDLAAAEEYAREVSEAPGQSLVRVRAERERLLCKE